MKYSILIPLLVTDMLYSKIAVPGRVNGGLHEMWTVEELMREDKLPTENKGPIGQFAKQSMKHFEIQNSQ